MTNLRVGLINRKSSMKNHPHQRKLRRSTGSQPVGCLGGPSQTEAGIAGRVIPSHSPRWSFRSLDDGDLANLVAGDHRVPTRALCSGHYLGISSSFRKDVERFASAAPQDHAKPSLSRATIQASPPVPPLRIVKPHLSSLKQRRTYKIKLIIGCLSTAQEHFVELMSPIYV